MTDTSLRQTPRLSFSQACSGRLEQHALTAPLASGTPADAVARMCGAHAQVMTAAEWSIGLRLAGSRKEDIQAALWTERSLVKTFGPRGTVHMLPAADLPQWTAALTALSRRPASLANTFLTPDQADEVIAAIGAAVPAAELTVDELGQAVIAQCGPWAGDPVIPAFNGMWPRWRQALSLAGARGVLCFGPGRDRNVTYTSPRTWLPGFQPAVPGGAALEWLVTQYLTAYGPATPKQFGQWLGAPRPWAADLFGSLAGRLREVELEGTTAWLPGENPIPTVDADGVRLLPYFDPYVVGCHPRPSLFPGVAAERGLNRTGQAGTKPVVLIDGLVGGLWHQQRSGRSIAITVEAFGQLTLGQQTELAAEAARLGEFFSCACTMTLGSVTARSHL